MDRAQCISRCMLSVPGFFILQGCSGLLAEAQLKQDEKAEVRSLDLDMKHGRHPKECCQLHKTNYLLQGCLAASSRLVRPWFLWPAPPRKVEKRQKTVRVLSVDINNGGPQRQCMSRCLTLFVFIILNFELVFDPRSGHP